MKRFMHHRRKWRRPRSAGLLVIIALLSGCADRQDEVTYHPVTFADLPGWQQDDFHAARGALARSCAVMRQPVWQEACTQLPTTDAGLRAYLENSFRPWQVAGATGTAGLFTGYYAPELPASRTRGGAYQTPIYGVPRDLLQADLGAFKPEWRGQKLTGRVEGKHFVPYPPRAAITAAALDAPVLAWAYDPVDVFFLQVQGSGRLRFPDDTVADIGYAGQNGRPYVAIGKVLKDQGAFPHGMVTMQAIRAWLAAHPQERDATLNQNPSYVFFKPTAAATGAQGVALTPERSLAVDKRFIPLGAPVWLDAAHPAGGRLQRLLVAQDTGGAISGAVRGDVYWGYGDRAAALAGIMQSRGAYFLLLPRGLQPPGVASDGR